MGVPVGSLLPLAPSKHTRFAIQAIKEKESEVHVFDGEVSRLAWRKR
jgi:hypothetical protein